MRHNFCLGVLIVAVLSMGSVASIAQGRGKDAAPQNRTPAQRTPTNEAALLATRRRGSAVTLDDSALGYNIQRPTEDRYLMTEAELRHKMAVLLC